MVIPGLAKALKKGGWNPPIVFAEQTGSSQRLPGPRNPLADAVSPADLIREGQYNIEKNWAPFLGEKDEVRLLHSPHCPPIADPSRSPQLFFHVSLVPQEIYKWVPGLTLRALDPAPPAHNCLTEVIGADMNRVKFHHATPLLRATLCRRGECVPDIHNTVLFGIIHIKYHPLVSLCFLSASRRGATELTISFRSLTSSTNVVSSLGTLQHLTTTSVFPSLSLTVEPTKPIPSSPSPSLVRPDLRSSSARSLAHNAERSAGDHPTDRHGLGLNHGFLDDVVVTSFGVVRSHPPFTWCSLLTSPRAVRLRIRLH